MPREWNTPQRECWTTPINQISKAIDNHSHLHLKTGDVWHADKAAELRQYLRDLKDWIYKQENKI